MLSSAGNQGPRAFVSNLYGSWITEHEVNRYTINDENGVKALQWIREQALPKALYKGSLRSKKMLWNTSSLV